MQEYSQFKKKFLQLTGLDLESYKDQQMERRIRQFMARVKITSHLEYYKLLETNDEERERFLNYLTINTTSFFRDPAVYKSIREQVLPDLLKRTRGRLKVWSAGCSIGAEPYSLSIILTEISTANRYAIVASDIDLQALARARKGQYLPDQLKDLDPVTLQRYFNQVGKSYEIKAGLKKNIQFKRLDLLKDAYEKDCDLILCRNVFIYFKKEIQEKMFEHFSAALNPQGYFVIGCSENISNYPRWGFKKVKMAVYQKA